MGVPKDYTGNRYGRLVALQMMGHRGKDRQWLFQCDCGNACVKTIADVIKESKLGREPSCGCLYSEHSRMAARVHGFSSHPLYHIWVGMRQRCRDKALKGYKNYGGRGIRVCDRWQSCKNFFEDMLPTWEPGLTLDRIDVNGNYEPKNCRWADMKTQGRNKRNNHLVGGVTVTELAEKYGIERGTLYARLRAGVPLEQLFAPLRGLHRKKGNATKS